MVVERIPTKSAINALSFTNSRLLANSPPKFFIAVDSPLMPTRKR
jgi:hypothetical protein